MTYWLDTVETIPPGVGFSLFDSFHIAWLLVFLVFTAISCILYRRLGTGNRKQIRRAYALLILGNELLKMAVLLIGGRYLPDYLPLHLCSINIFIIAYHALRPGKMLDNFLYIICIPGALAALLFPGWTPLPGYNLLNIHSFTVHILLAAYPIMLLAGGDIVPDIRYLPHCLALLGGLALVAQCANLLLGTNFMFLMFAAEGNPLRFFQEAFGSHLIGFPIIITGSVIVMYTPFLIRNWRKSTSLK